MSRRTRTFLPTRDTQLKPKVVKDVITRKQAKGITVKHRYDTRARDMPTIIQGQTVRVLLHPNNPDGTWTLGICIDQLSDRSYIVLVKGKKYRRNRKDILPVPEQLQQAHVKNKQTPLPDDDWDAGSVQDAPVDTDQQRTSEETVELPDGQALQHTRSRSNIRRPLRYTRDFVS
ncbi:hypothetical protein AAFF_G00382920 [Aldrovandia affinis]|uniref:Integrase catalytic domain-containing protein n=1 Tax=Aldrovandia affinis TaxID=143900 RepID=A0AAD7T8G1_9TELE|nr:hypothetical protein AAFF_G00382920 [Aldrovandia affinis]